jgi:hypothetical protein
MREFFVSIFGNIMSKIFGHAGGASGATSTSSNQTAAAPIQGGQSAGSAQTSSAAPAGGQTGASQNVDVASILDGLASKNSQKLDWKHSIVDMMKLLDMDSSLSARKELASELHYSGDTSDSAAMNIWLHKQVMQKLAENGGKVPEELKH